jgi:hypothetical protein
MDNPLTLKIVSLGLILTCIVVIILFIVFVHTMPGKIARKRNNPQAEAIEILSLLGLLIFPLWMAALVWAYVRPFKVPVIMEPDTAASPGTRSPSAAVAGAERGKETRERPRHQQETSAPDPQRAAEPGSHDGAAAGETHAAGRASRPGS